ncbi:MAG: amidohydrolase family protein [Cyanobacteria bacterium P01_H01_bin.74]
MNNDSQTYTADWIFPVSQAPIAKGYITIENQKVSALGFQADLPEAIPVEAHAVCISPGFVNGHCHLEQSFSDRVPVERYDDTGFVNWLLAVTKISQQTQKPAEKMKRIAYGIQQLLATGTTAVNDIAFDETSLVCLHRAGLKGVVSLEYFHPASQPINVKATTQRYQQCRQALESLNAQNNRTPDLALGLSPHSLYNVSAEAWQAVLHDLDQRGFCPHLIHTHLSEFEAETQYIRGVKNTSIHALHQAILGKSFDLKTTADSPVQLLKNAGLLKTAADWGIPVVGAHALTVSANDCVQLSQNNLSIVSCPRSNLNLHNKCFNWQQWDICGQQQGQSKQEPNGIALGTDGLLSTETLDMRDEARQAMANFGWSAKQALEALTIRGTSALSLRSVTGNLSIGQPADFVLWDWVQDNEVLQPVHSHSYKDNPEAMLFERNLQVCRTLINGNLAYAKKDKMKAKPETKI